MLFIPLEKYAELKTSTDPLEIALSADSGLPFSDSKVIHLAFDAIDITPGP